MISWLQRQSWSTNPQDWKGRTKDGGIRKKTKENWGLLWENYSNPLSSVGYYSQGIFLSVLRRARSIRRLPDVENRMKAPRTVTSVMKQEEKK